MADSVAKQPWDPSVQSMAAVPEVVKRLTDDIQWTTELGNAFLAQQPETMEAVQRMRAKAKGKGALESNDKQKVETKVVEKDTVIIVQQTNPEVIYVPTYNPTYVYGPPVYPYPPVYYPPYTPGAAFVSFGFGMMMGAAIWGGSCCHYGGWGGGNNTVIINNNNNFNQINHNRNGGAGNGNWQPQPVASRRYTLRGQGDEQQVRRRIPGGPGLPAGCRGGQPGRRRPGLPAGRSKQPGRRSPGPAQSECWYQRPLRERGRQPR